MLRTFFQLIMVLILCVILLFCRFWIKVYESGDMTTYCSDAGDRVKYIGASSAGLSSGLALLSHATTSGYRQQSLGCWLSMP